MRTLRITIVAAGSRGDVQPHVALGVGLLAAGHDLRFLASADLRDLVEDHGLEFVAGSRLTRSLRHPAQTLCEIRDRAWFAVFVWRVLTRLPAS